MLWVEGKGGLCQGRLSYANKNLALEQLTPIQHKGVEEIIHAEHQTNPKSDLHHVIRNSPSVELWNKLPSG